MARKAQTDSDGNARVGEVARIGQQAIQLVGLCRNWEKSLTRYSQLRSVTIYPPSRARNGMWLIVGKAWSDGERLVAFHRSPDVLTALLGFFQKVAQATIVWKVDAWSDEPRWDR